MAIKYKWLASLLKEQIINNLKNGKLKFPSEQELCARYQVSRQTVRQSLALLEQDGLIIKKKGSGSYLTGLSPDPLSNTVCLLLSSDREYIYPGILYDIRQVLEPFGFTIKVFATGNRLRTEQDILLSLQKNPPRGMIVEGCKSALPNPSLHLYRSLMNKGTAMVFLHSHYPALPESVYIKDGNLSGSTLLVRHLAEQGHKYIGGIFKGDDLQGVERFQGFLEALKEQRLDFSDEQIGWYDSRDLESLLQEGNGDFLRSFIRRSLSGCTAVICYNDILAYHLQKELRLEGFHLPEDMAVAAFDNTYLSDGEGLSITTLSHRPHEMGRKAARALLDKLKGLPVSSQEVPWQLNIKESTRKKLD